MKHRPKDEQCIQFSTPRGSTFESWFSQLDAQGRFHINAQLPTLARSTRIGRFGGRVMRLPGTKRGLFAYFVTPPGAPPPHLVLIYCVRNGTIVFLHPVASEWRPSKRLVAVAERQLDLLDTQADVGIHLNESAASSQASPGI